MRKVVIVNNFKGPVSWKNDFNCECIVYNKYNPRIEKIYWKTPHESIYDYYKRLFTYPNFLEIMKPLPEEEELNFITNVGHETSTFFGHIAKNYDDIADMNIFLHNTPFHHCKNIIELVNNISEPIDFIEFGTVMTSDVNGGPTDTCPVGDIFHQLFPDKPIPETYYFASGSLFGISKQTVYKMGKSFFEQCVKISETMPLAPWAFERLFRTIFKETEL